MVVVLCRYLLTQHFTYSLKIYKLDSMTLGYITDFYFIIVLMSCIIISLSSGLEVATNIVKVARVSLLILSIPFLYKALFLSKKYKNIVAPILLFPSIKL